MPRCGIPAPSRRATDDETAKIRPLNAGGLSQRDNPLPTSRW